MRYLAGVVWTICVVIAGYVLISGINIPNTQYQGTKIEFTISSNDFSIQAESATGVTASPYFYVLRNKGDTIIGVLTDKPTGWPYSEYYTSKPQPIKNGTWSVEAGSNITMKLSSETENNVEVITNPGLIGTLKFLAFIVAVFIYAIGLVVITALPGFPDS